MALECGIHGVCCPWKGEVEEEVEDEAQSAAARRFQHLPTVTLFTANPGRAQDASRRIDPLRSNK